jgi:hypothetical protein
MFDSGAVGGGDFFFGTTTKTSLAEMNMDMDGHSSSFSSRFYFF